MSILTVNLEIVNATDIIVSNDTLTVNLKDGRSISVPLEWYPRLVHGSVKERNNWRLIGEGQGIHWSDLDEDISIEGIILGKHSAESQSSFDKWLVQRKKV